MTRLLPFVLLLGACGKTEDSSTGISIKSGGTTQGSCDVVAETDIALDEAAGDPLNFSAQNALDELSSGINIHNVLAWPDENTVQLDVEFNHDGGQTKVIEREANGALPQQELVRCFTAIAIPGTLTFTSGDGSFNETVNVTLEAKKRREGAVLFEISQSALVGTWTPETSGLDSGLSGLTLEFDGFITDIGSEGVLTAKESDGTEHDAGAWAPPPTQG